MNNNDITLSVVVLSYNNEQYITECLESIYNQGIDKYEVFVIDDSSTDDSARVIKEYIQDKPNFYLIEKENSGGAVSSQIGVEKAKGKYLAIVDCDDVVAEGAYKRLINRIEEDDSDFAGGLPAVLHFGFMFSYVGNIEESNIFAENRVLETPDEKTIFSNQGFYWNCVFRTDFIKENNIYMPSHLLLADRIFLYKAIIKARRISVDKNVVYYWRRKANKEKLSLTDRQKEYPMIADRCDSFSAQMRVSIENYKESHEYNKGMWENSLERLYYPLFSTLKDSDDDFESFEILCDRYRYLLMEYQSFFGQLVNNSSLPLNVKYVTEMIMCKKFRELYDVLKNKTDLTQLAKSVLSPAMHNAVIKNEHDLSVRNIFVDNDKIYLYIQQKKQLEDRGELEVKEIYVNNRYFNNVKTILPFNSKALKVDISDLSPSTYMLKAKYSVGKKTILGNFAVADNLSEVKVAETNDKVVTFNTKLSMLNILEKNNFTVLYENEKYFLKVNSKCELKQIFFFNVQENCRIYLEEVKKDIYAIDKTKLLSGLNILLYENREGLYNIVSGHECSNNEFQMIKYQNIFNKNRIEIELD